MTKVIQLLNIGEFETILQDTVRQNQTELVSNRLHKLMLYYTHAKAVQ